MQSSSSGLVTGFCRDVACNVSETKDRIAPRNVVPTLNAKSRLRPLGGLKPALRPPSGILIGIVRRRKNLSFSKWRRKALCEFRLGNACASVKPRWLCSFYQQQHSWRWHSGYLFRNGLEEIRTLFLGLFGSSSSCLKKSSYINAPGDRYILSK